MKMTKKQNVVYSILFVIVVILGTCSITVFSRNVKQSYALSLEINSVSNVNAADIVAIRASSSTAIRGYYIGTTDDIRNATFYLTSSNNYKVSLLNGTYYFWVKDASGATAKYGRTITISNSCTSNYQNNVKGSGNSKHCYFTSDGKYLEETKSEELVRCANGYTRDVSKTSVVQDTCSNLSASSIKNMGLSKKVCYKVWSYACVPTGNTSSSGTTSNSSSNSNRSALSVVSATTSNDWTNSNKEITVTSQKGSSNIAGYYISTNSSKPNANSGWQASSSTTWTTSQGAGTYYIWVKDAAGNISSNYKSVTISKIETTKPHVNSVIPSSANKTITINASDDGGSGIAGYYISNENNAPSLSSSWNNSNENTYTINKDPGTYYVWVKDAAGNISNSKSVIMASASSTDNNMLSSLTIKGIEISPAFDANTFEYEAISNVSKISVDATLQDSNASFEKKYGPRTVNLKSGVNNVVIKIKSALGSVKEYKIKVTYNGKSSTKTSARLKSLKLNSGNLTFDPDITEYRMYVPKSLENLEVSAVAEDSNADVKIDQPETLEVGDNKVTITVTSTDGTSKVYTLNIIKKTTEEISTNNYLESLSITGYDIKFEREVLNYAIKLGNKTYINVNAVAEDSNAEVTIDSTKYLTKDSIVKVMVRAEDGSARIYKIAMNKKGSKVLLVILIILGVLVGLLLIAYIILRILGYSVYVNFGAIKDFFINLFRKNKD